MQRKQKKRGFSAAGIQASVFAQDGKISCLKLPWQNEAGKLVTSAA